MRVDADRQTGLASFDLSLTPIASHHLAKNLLAKAVVDAAKGKRILPHAEEAAQRPSRRIDCATLVLRDACCAATQDERRWLVNQLI